MQLAISGQVLTKLTANGDNVKAPNIFQRAKEEMEAVVETVKAHHNHHKETHGENQDIDENTPSSDVKAPNVFERAKEEVQALVQVIHEKKESLTNGNRDESTNAEPNQENSENGGKAHHLIEKAKEEIGAILHEKLPLLNHHHKETHGTSNDIDENTPIDEVKAPSVFERAKEEVEAIIETIHPSKKESVDDHVSSAEKDDDEKGFRHCLALGLERICRPSGSKKD